MNRRNLFRTLTACICASAMDLGWRAPRLDSGWELIADRIYGNMRRRSPWSQLIEKGKLPEGAGYNYMSVITSHRNPPESLDA